MNADEFEDLSIPRRPTWTRSTTAQELDEAERKAFLDWRRGIAQCVRSSRPAARASPSRTGRFPAECGINLR